MDCRNGFCTAEAGRCLLRPLPRKPQVLIERILTHLGLQARAPPRAPARERQLAQAA